MDEYEFFLSDGVDQYAGEWVALCSKEVIAHGKDFEEVYAAARSRCKHRTPFVALVPSRETMIL